MLYRNIRTGRVIETSGKIKSPAYEEVKAGKAVTSAKPARTVRKEK